MFTFVHSLRAQTVNLDDLMGTFGGKVHYFFSVQGKKPVLPRLYTQNPVWGYILSYSERQNSSLKTEKIK